jgi:hypothetical protein
MADAPAARRIEVKLDPNAVVEPIRSISSMTANVVARFLHLSRTNEDVSINYSPGKTRIVFNITGIESKDIIATGENWIISQGFKELLRGLRDTFEEAFLYLTFIDLHDSVIEFSELGRFVDKIKRDANKKNFPDLLQFVDERLSKPLDLRDQIESLQKVRNCIEHRRGIVGIADVNKGGDTMALKFMSLGLFTIEDEDEIEIEVGYQTKKDQVIKIKPVIVERNFKIGERIIIETDDFFKIAYACHLLGEDLGAKLPLPVGSPP